MSQFIHLHLHTEYSLADSIVRVPELMQQLSNDGMSAVALTDFNNLFALVKFYQKALKNGIKPIIGVEAQISGLSAKEPNSRVVFLCKNNQGYQELTKLVTRSYLEGQRGSGPTLEREWLIEAGKALSGNLIVLSGGRDGDVGRAILAGNKKLAVEYVAFWQKYFKDNYYIELQRTDREEEDLYNQQAVRLAGKYSLPVVATNDVRFLEQSEFDAHEVRVCIHTSRVLNDPRRPQLYSPQQYLRSSEEMLELFKDIPEAISNTVEIAKRCNVTLSFGENVLPEFPIPETHTVPEYMREQAENGLTKRLEKLQINDAAVKLSYKERLDIELEVINSMGYAGYFLIVADFTSWAKANEVPVGPGRGSGAGSLVAYVLGITDVDPLKYDLLFERFLNPERVSMPDFDIDFC
ncbi:MAG: DNA polymerase III subunit alpha, partial [Gammaproteobacteria bacterium]